MSFLRFEPAVYIIGEEYEIAVALNEFGTLAVKINGETFHEKNSGVLPSERYILQG